MFGSEGMATNNGTAGTFRNYTRQSIFGGENLNLGF
jgi:hypothetical protein